jgi:MFS family permease
MGRRVIVPLLLLFGITGACISFATTFSTVLMLRFLQGIGASGLVALAVTLIGDLYDGSQRDAIIGLNGSVIGIGAAFYPVLGGGLATIRWSTPFLFFGISVAVGLFAAVSLPNSEDKQSINIRNYLRGLREMMLYPQVMGVFSSRFTVMFVFYGAILTALPLVLSDEFRLSAGQIGPLLGMVSIANATVASQYGRIAQRRSSSELLALGFIAYGTSLLGIWFAEAPAFIGISLLVFGMGFGIVMPSIDTVIITIGSDQHRAGMMGVRTSLIRLGQTLGPISFTFMADHTFHGSSSGYLELLFLSGIFMIVVGGSAYVCLRS